MVAIFAWILFAICLIGIVSIITLIGQWEKRHWQEIIKRIRARGQKRNDGR